MKPKLRQKNMCMNNNNKTTTIDKMECRESKGQDLREVKAKDFSIKSFTYQERLLDFSGSVKTIMRVLAVFNILKNPLFYLSNIRAQTSENRVTFFLTYAQWLPCIQASGPHLYKENERKGSAVCFVPPAGSQRPSRIPHCFSTHLSLAKPVSCGHLQQQERMQK